MPKLKEIQSELRVLPKEDCALIAAAQVPEYIGVKRQTLARWRHEGFGPPFVKLGRRLVAYFSGDLRNWLRQNIRTNTINDGSGSHE